VVAGTHLDYRHDALQTAPDLDVPLNDDRIGKKFRPVGAETQRILSSPGTLRQRNSYRISMTICCWHKSGSSNPAMIM
jgi:hypothetical protein